MIFPDKLVQFKAYGDDNVLAGTVDVEIPDLKFLTEKLEVAGIAGPIDVPVLGLLEAMTAKINFRMVTKRFAGLMSQKTHSLELRGIVQSLDSTTGEIIASPCRVAMRFMPLGMTPGKWEQAKATGSAIEASVLYLKFTLDGVDLFEVDKLNMKYKAGEDSSFANLVQQFLN